MKTSTLQLGLSAISILFGCIYGHVNNYVLRLDVASSRIDEEPWGDTDPKVGHYTLLPDPEHTGIPIYKNDDTGEELLFDGKNYWQMLDDSLVVHPEYPNDSRGNTQSYSTMKS